MEQGPSIGQLLHVWEQGCSQTPVHRSLSLLALAAPEVPAEELANYSVGRRDHALFRLRERIFGPRMTGLARCPACGQEVDLVFSAAALRMQMAFDTVELHTVQCDPYEVSFRLPTCGDLAMLSPGDDASGIRSTLLQRCVSEARRDGEVVNGSLIPEGVMAAVSERMAEVDPYGDIQLSLSCPECSRSWQSSIDIVSYLWSEIESWAVRMLRDVHALASAYGWRESDILGMSPWRRQAYLEMIEQ